MFSRIKQGIRYIFFKFDEKKLNEIKDILTDEEYRIFCNMQDYDKLHSYLVYKKMKDDKILKNKKKYLKLALLHDCGKGRVTLLRRIKKVLFGDKILELHPDIAYEKLKKIDIEVAVLCKEHHKEAKSVEMEKFQELDNE